MASAWWNYLRGNSTCAPCPRGAYSEHRNSLRECLRCISPCKDNEVETIPCKATSNRKCECKPEYRCEQQAKNRCEECVLRPTGSCNSGFFLNHTSTSKCQPYTK
nr:PREDICTED: tumor necrosis factor receptor superfamily member 8-like [Latimeria chalumnae]|eukprot:XP_006001362.1 PREDICTED: tumor necrosis factor receptor superfamily member 8-like [Latimeria chalumnae]